MTTKSGLKIAAVVGALALVAAAFMLVRYQPTVRTTPLANSSPCEFQQAAQPVHVAFCDTFDHAAAPNSTRSGALDPTVWGVSRVVQGGPGVKFQSGNNASTGIVDNFAPVHSTACGGASVTPNADVQICNGQLFDSANDDGGQTALAMYPRQPFDIAGRTGTVTLDVSDNSQGGHASWPTFVYTDQPVPAPYSDASGIVTSARNSFGFTLDGVFGNGSSLQNGCSVSGTGVSVGSVFETRNYQETTVATTGIAGTINSSLGTYHGMGCMQESTSPTSLNHVELQISTSKVVIWGSDAGSTKLVELGELDGASLPLTRGLIWMEDNHYNADKFNSQQSNTFGWDNVGFDGPTLPRDLGFDVPNNGKMAGTAEQLGWSTGGGSNGAATVTAPNVHGIANASGALMEFNWFADDESVPSISVNGNPYISTAWPFGDTKAEGLYGPTYVWRTIAVPVPLSQIKSGSNTITFKNAPGGFANVDIILQGAGGVPTCLDPSSCATSTAPPPTAAATSSPTPTVTPSASSSPTLKPTSGPAPKLVRIRKVHCSVTLPSGQKETGTCSGTFTRNGG